MRWFNFLILWIAWRKFINSCLYCWLLTVLPSFNNQTEISLLTPSNTEPFCFFVETIFFSLAPQYRYIFHLLWRFHEENFYFFVAQEVFFKVVSRFSTNLLVKLWVLQRQQTFPQMKFIRYTTGYVFEKNSTILIVQKLWQTIANRCQISEKRILKAYLLTGISILKITKTYFF